MTADLLAALLCERFHPPTRDVRAERRRILAESMPVRHLTRGRRPARRLILRHLTCETRPWESRRAWVESMWDRWSE